MNKEKVKTILLKSLVKESVDLERLHQNIQSNTEIGKAWITFINGLEKMLEETNEFSSLYRTANQPPLDITTAQKEIRQILASAVRMMKNVEEMHKVQYKDLYS